MENNRRPSVWERSTTRRFLRWLFCWRTIRRGLIGLAWGVTIIALLYGFINWRGRHAWNEYRTPYEAHVASLDLSAYIPKPVPDSENFAAISLIHSWFNRADTNSVFDKDHFGRMPEISSLRPMRGRAHPRFCDLVAFRDVFAAGDRDQARSKKSWQSNQLDAQSRAQAAPAVLEELKDDEAVFNELRQASTRAHARYPIEYNMDNPWAVLLPHLAKIKQCCLRLQLKACAELALNQSANALDDTKLALYLADSLKEEPFLISYLVRMACMQIAIGPVWEGLAENRWSDAQLQELQSSFQRYDFARDLESCLHAERAAGVLTVDIIRRKGYRDFSGISGSDTQGWSIASLIPSGWCYQEMLQYCRLFDLQFKDAWDVAARKFSPSQINSNSAALDDLISGSLRPFIHHRLIARMMLPALGKTLIKTAASQTSTDQTTIACALERYRLANGQFPEALQILSPKFISSLPNDVITGGPCKYRRTPDGRFILYSVGWNEKDDGGISAQNFFDDKEGDWVWSYPHDAGPNSAMTSSGL